MKKLFCLLLFVSAAFAQNSRFDGVVQARSGFPAPGALVAVCVHPCTVPANVSSITPPSVLVPLCSSHTDAACTSPNPVTADGLGNYGFYVKPGRYDVVFYGSGLTAKTLSDQILPCDPVNCALPTTSVLCWNNDTGFSRLSAAILGLGTCVAGNTTGELTLKTLDAGQTSSAGVILNGTAPGLNIGQVGVVGFNSSTPSGGSVDAGISRVTGGVLALGTGAAGATNGNLQATQVNLATGGLLSWNIATPDAGLSRTAAATVACGNGTQADTTCTFLASKVASGGAMAGGSSAGDMTAARSSTSGALYLGTDGNGFLFRNGNAATLQGTTLVWTFPGTTDTLVGKATTDTLTNKTVTGAGSGNSITLLNDQTSAAAITGNNTDLTVYTYTIPANTIQASKGIRVTVVSKHTTGNGAVTYKLKLGATTLDSNAITSNANVGNDDWSYRIMNNSGVQTAQHWSRALLFISVATGSTNANNGTSAENTANSLALTYTMNAANTEQVTPIHFLVELIQ